MYRFNSVEQRAFLAMIGICSIGLGIATCYGLAGLFGVKNTSMNSILPFLLLGIGIDDMFVIVQSFTNIKVRSSRTFVPIIFSLFSIF